MNLRLVISLLTILALAILTFRSSLETTLCTQAPSARSRSYTDGRSIIERRFASFIAPPELPDGSWATKQSSIKGGFLWVQHNTTSAVSWEVSMAHALHCMAVVRRLVMGKSIGMGSGEDGPPEHVIHCMDYIVQSLICAADDTIEPATTLWEDDGTVVEHTGIRHDSFVHQCRDSSDIWEVIEQSERMPLKLRAWKDGDTLRSVLRH